MNEAEARQTLLVRAFEDPLAAPWSAADRDVVSRESASACSEATPPDRLIAHRAALAVPRIVAREPLARAALVATTWPAWAAPGLWLLAFGLGLAMDGLGNARHINLFALPLLAMLAWNLVVYVALAVNAMRSHGGMDAPPWLRRVRLPGTGRLTPGLQRFVADWAGASLHLQAARLAGWLHTGAALVAVGAVVSMYARGTFFEFRAGWESTFFDAATMHRLVTWLLGPAAWASGVALPGPQEFATLRLSAGGGEIAARWIHLLAITAVGVVVLPRALLAALAAWRADRLARDLPLALDDAYFRHLLRGRGGPPRPVQVLPYSYQVPQDALADVQDAIEAVVGGAITLQLSVAAPMGDDDEDAAPFALAPTGAPPAAVVALFAATATPERETHGVFMERLAAQAGPRTRLIMVVDESGFRRRFGGAEGSARLQQRRAAWEKLGLELGTTTVFAGAAAGEPGP